MHLANFEQAQFVQVDGGGSGSFHQAQRRDLERQAAAVNSPAANKFCSALGGFQSSSRRRRDGFSRERNESGIIGGGGSR